MNLEPMLTSMRTRLIVLAERTRQLGNALTDGGRDSIVTRLQEAAHTLSGLSDDFRVLATEMALPAAPAEPEPAPPVLQPEYVVELDGARLFFDQPAVKHIYLPGRYEVPAGTKFLRAESAGRNVAVDLDFEPDGTFPADWGIPFHVVDEEQQPSRPITLNPPDRQAVVVYTRRTEAERAAADQSSNQSFVHDVAVIHVAGPGLLAPPLFAKANLMPFIDYNGLEKWLDDLDPVTLDTAKALDAINSLGLLLETNLGWTQRHTHAAAQVPEYGRDIATLIGDVGLAMHDKQIPVGTRRKALYMLLQIGIDAHANLQARRFADGKDFAYEADGGHGNGRYYPFLLAAELLGLSTARASRFSEIGQSYQVSLNGSLYDWRMRPGLHTNRAATYPARSAEAKAEKYRVLACNSIVATLVPATLQLVGQSVDYALRRAMQSHIEWQRGMGLSGAYGLAETYLDNIDDQILDY